MVDDKSLTGVEITTLKGDNIKKTITDQTGYEAPVGDTKVTFVIVLLEPTYVENFQLAGDDTVEVSIKRSPDGEFVSKPETLQVGGLITIDEVVIAIQVVVESTGPVNLVSTKVCKEGKHQRRVIQSAGDSLLRFCLKSYLVMCRQFLVVIYKLLSSQLSSCILFSLH